MTIIATRTRTPATRGRPPPGRPATGRAAPPARRRSGARSGAPSAATATTASSAAPATSTPSPHAWRGRSLPTGPTVASPGCSGTPTTPSSSAAATTVWWRRRTWPGRASAPCVLERRPVVGGAAVTEQPWGPDYKVTMLSYVVSLLPPTILRDLQLERHGYRVHPQGPYFVPYPDGRSLQLPGRPGAPAGRDRQVLRQGRRRLRAVGRAGCTAWPRCSGRC